MTRRRRDGRKDASPAVAPSPGPGWSVARKRDVALRLLRGEPLEALSRELSVEAYLLEGLRERALGDFVERCDHGWRMEKLGFLTPSEARLDYSRGAAAGKQHFFCKFAR